MNRQPKARNSSDEILVRAFLLCGGKETRVPTVLPPELKDYKERVIAFKRGRTRSLNAHARNRQLAQTWKE